MKVYIDGKFYPENQAKVSVFDHGFLYGDGIFETFLVHSGDRAMYGAHFRRLGAAARRLALTLPFSLAGLRRAVAATLRRNRLQEAVIRVMVTRGRGSWSLSTEQCEKPILVIFAAPIRAREKALYDNGVKVCLAPVYKTNPRSLEAGLKTFNYLGNVLAKAYAARQGAFEGILLSHNGLLAEGTVSNLFFVKQGRLMTPSLLTGILPGITRDTVIKAARDLDLPVQEGFYKPGELFTADEVFLTNSVMGVMPVTVVGGKKVADGLPGPLTQLLAVAYDAAESAN